MRKITPFVLCILMLTAWGCAKDVACGSFELNAEYYWPPVASGDTVVFSNESNVRKAFVATVKSVFHRSTYKSKSGCGCLDKSFMALKSGQDSMWFNSRVSEGESGGKTQYEDVNYKTGGLISLFENSVMEILPTYTIGTVTFSNVKKFTNSVKSLPIQVIYLVENVGVIRFEMKTGEVWTNIKLTESTPVTISSFAYSEGSCG